MQTQIHCCMHIRLLAVRWLAVRLHAHTVACTDSCMHILLHTVRCTHVTHSLHTVRCTHVTHSLHTVRCNHTSHTRCTLFAALTRHTLAAHCLLYARLMSLLHAGRINCCYRSVRVRLVVTYRIFASLTAAQHDHSVLPAFRPVRASTRPAQHSSSKACSAEGWPKPAAILKFNFNFTNGRRPIIIIITATDLGWAGNARNVSSFVPSAPPAAA